MVDEFDDGWEELGPRLKATFVKADYVGLFGFIQWVIRHPRTPYGLSDEIDGALRDARAAYRILDHDTIVPIGSEAELISVKKAFADVATAEFGGARSHLRAAALGLTSGNWASSIRESIHAVESVARVLEPTAKTLEPALENLARATKLHPALKAGFAKLYGFTNDEKGIRHALLDEPVSVADEADALYMFGACASFVSYLITKSRTEGTSAAEFSPKNKSSWPAKAGHPRIFVFQRQPVVELRNQPYSWMPRPSRGKTNQTSPRVHICNPNRSNRTAVGQARP